MKLIVGLGNPGSKYQLTRHNIGFMLVDAFSRVHGRGDFREEHKALVEKIGTGSDKILLAKPQTFMNLSGESVRALVDYYQIPLADILIVHDDVDLPFKQMRYQSKRSPGGHNGIKSTHQHLGTDDYARLKMGVRPNLQPGEKGGDHVLGNFSKEEMAAMSDFIARAVESVDFFIRNSLEKTANKFNGSGE